MSKRNYDISKKQNHKMWTCEVTNSYGITHVNYFETKEEAETEAEKIGCKGSHEHTQDGKTYFMPCETHDQIKKANLNKCGCNTELSEKTELESCIEEF